MCGHRWQGWYPRSLRSGLQVSQSMSHESTERASVLSALNEGKNTLFSKGHELITVNSPADPDATYCPRWCFFLMVTSCPSFSSATVSALAHLCIFEPENQYSNMSILSAKTRSKSRVEGQDGSDQTSYTIGQSISGSCALISVNFSTSSMAIKMALTLSFCRF